MCVVCVREKFEGERRESSFGIVQSGPRCMRGCVYFYMLQKAKGWDHLYFMRTVDEKIYAYRLV